MNRPPVLIILAAELRAWRNRLIKGRSRRTIVVGGLLVVAAVTVGGSIFSLADAASQFLPSARDSMLVGAFTALSILMLVIGFPTVIANFFVGADLVQLVLAPVRPIDIFLARAVLAMRANLLLGFVILAFVLGVGAGAAAPLTYFAAAVGLVLLQVLVVTGLQAFLLSLVLRVVPARLARDVSVVAASISGAGIYLLWQVTLRQTIGRHADVSGLVSLAQRTDWLPSAWPGHALSAVLDGAATRALEWFALALVFGVALIAIAARLYGATLLAGISQLGGAQARWKARAARPARPVQRGRVSPEMAIARKDWISYRRDVRRLSRLLPAVIFLIGYALVLTRPSRGIAGFWNDVFLVAFVSMFLSMALATSAIPSERRGFQILRMAPIDIWAVFRAKILLTMLPIVALVLLVSVGVAIAGSDSPREVFELAGLAVWLGLGFAAIGVSAGAIDPRFDALDDRRMVGPVGTFTGLGAELAFGVLSILAFILLHVSAQVLAGTAPLGNLPPSPAFAAAFAVAAVVFAGGAAAGVGVLLRMAASRLRRFEESIASS